MRTTRRWLGGTPARRRLSAAVPRRRRLPCRPAAPDAAGAPAAHAPPATAVPQRQGHKRQRPSWELGQKASTLLETALLKGSLYAFYTNWQ